MAATQTMRPTFCICFLFAIALILSHNVVVGQKKLRMVSMVYRHGDRSPETIYPFDKNSAYWPQGPGQLTQTGMRQEYRLGQFIKKRYRVDNKLLNDTAYIRDEVYCRSTDYDRTMMSAQSQMNGLYPPQGRQIWRPTVDWQPIPVRMEPKNNDKLLLGKQCPNYDKLLHESYEDPEYKELEMKSKDFVERVSLLAGLDEPLPFQSVYSLYDNLFCLQTHNLTLPTWADTTVMATLKNISQFSMYWLCSSQEKAKLKYGLLLGEMVKHMQDFVNKDKGIKKAYIYSAHDVTISGFLSLLGVYDRISPPYSSAAMLELYSSDDKNDHSVRIFYRFGQSDDPRQLKLKGCDLDCPMDEFIKLTKKLIPENRDSECGLKEPKCLMCKSPDKGYLIAFVITLVVLILLCFGLLCCWCKGRRGGSSMRDNKVII